MSFTKLSSQQYAQTLVAGLVPLADNLRDLLTQVGLRPYLVRIVKTRWTGGLRNEGQEVIASTLDLLPTPKVVSLNALEEILQPVGLDEVGKIQVAQISGSFTEDQLRGYDAAGVPPGDDEQVYYEIEFPVPNGGDSIRRRFALRGAPMYYAGRLQWIVELERTRSDRERSGEVG